MTEQEPQAPRIMKPEVRKQIEAAKSSTVLIEGLKYLGNLTELNLSGVDKELQPQLTRLFECTQERIILGGRDRHLPGLIKDFFLNQPSATEWVTDTDAKHTVASFDYLTEIANGETFNLGERKIVLSAMIVHDCAYPEVEDYRGARVQHMVDGENEFRNFAQQINAEFPDFYSNDEIEIICSIVRQHDNPSVKKDGQRLQFSYDPPPAKLLWAHREADRLWMLDRGGFTLDLIRRALEDNPTYDPSEYLKYVVSRHLTEAKNYQDNESCLLYHGQKSLYRTRTGFEIFQRLIMERAEEYGVNI